MKKFHPNLTEGKWFTYNFYSQMGNIGSEVGRLLKWQQFRRDYADLAFYRALELLDLTIADPKNRTKLKELTRLREFLADYYLGSNTYQFVPEWYQKYFLAFTIAARK